MDKKKRQEIEAIEEQILSLQMELEKIHPQPINPKPSTANREAWHDTIYIEVDAAFMSLLGNPMNLDKIRDITVESILGAIDPLLEPKVLTDEERMKQATKILKYSHGEDIEWGHSGTMDDESWRRIERLCLALVDSISEATIKGVSR